MYERLPSSNFMDVGRFHRKFGLPSVLRRNDEGPRLLDQDVLEFRMKFLIEEILEFIDAAGYVLEHDSGGTRVVKVNDNLDHAKMFDALLDEVYVALGTAHLLGYPWQQGWNLVQKANMAKVRAKADGSDSLRGSSFDVVKPEGWTAPDIAGLLAECGWDINQEDTQ